jgi:hypothetical protein
MRRCYVLFFPLLLVSSLCAEPSKKEASLFLEYERETAKQFSLGQNFPNPFDNFTTVPFKLINTSDVKFDLYDLQGKIVKTIEIKNLNAGDHEIKLDLAASGIARSSYAYQLEIKNSNGVFRDCKFMTAEK